jgi:hypothetical protein
MAYHQQHLIGKFIAKAIAMPSCSIRKKSIIYGNDFVNCPVRMSEESGNQNIQAA